jgi:hypothetical protein
LTTFYIPSNLPSLSTRLILASTISFLVLSTIAPIYPIVY